MEFQSLAPLGKKNVFTDVEILGQVARFLDLDYSLTGVKKTQSQMPVWARLVRNDSGGTLAAGGVCRWDVGTTYGPGKAVDGLAAIGSNQMPAGVVDPWISGTVAEDETFWLIFNGPCKFLFTTGTTITNGDVLTLGAAGRAVRYNPAAADAEDNLNRLGRTLATVDTAIASDTLFRGFADIRF